MTSPTTTGAAVDAAPPPVPAVAVDRLVKRYGNFEAVRGISFEVHQGEIFGLLGPNGAGKTTTIEVLIGLRDLTTGSVHILGHDLTKDSAHTRSLIGIQLQESDFFDHLTLAEQLHFLGACYGMKPDIDALLRFVELEDRAKWKLGQCSGGQKQRFAIAASLVNNPPLVLLDEPSTGLDPSARRKLWGLIRALRDSGRTVLLSTHYMEEAEALCDRVAIMNDGRIAGIDTPLALIEQLLATGFKREVEVRDATLEDVFHHLTGRSLDDTEETGEDD